MRPVRTIDAAQVDDGGLHALFSIDDPLLIKGLGAEWPLVQQAGEGPDAAIAYLLSFYCGSPVVGYTGAPEIGGRFFYGSDLRTMNFEAARVRLDDYLARIRDYMDDPAAPSLYVGSTDLGTYLPGLADENGIALSDAVFGGSRPLASIWIGNRTIAAAHYDMSNNIACCMAGRRRFTLFPPEQVSNLYPGPLSPTPGGQVVSMVDMRDPDSDRFPRFAAAIEAAQVADMEPGDVLLYPAMWWHEVEALESFNILINYWWNTSPTWLDTPQTTLLHALLSLRDRPQHEKQAWKALFDHYVFGAPDQASAHLPPHAQGPLGPMTELEARRLRAQLLNRLNR